MENFKDYLMEHDHQNQNIEEITELGHVPVSISIDLIQPSPENERLYRPVLPSDPEIRDLAKSILEHGIREPIVITTDYYIISGHRRFVAAKLAGLTSVPCRTENINRAEDPDRFLVLLREYNRQREKNFGEKLRETVVDCNKEEAYAALVEYRKIKAKVNMEGMSVVGSTNRCVISKAKIPFLNSVVDIINSLKKYWPLSDRQIHYQLLNRPPLVHSSKPYSVYRNNPKSYKALTDLLTRARLQGFISWNAINDPTRPIVTWNIYRDCSSYLSNQLNVFCRTYYRDFMQSQPSHIEIVGEKLTVKSIIEQVAVDYCIPMTIGRGYCSLQPRFSMAQRFKKSGKDTLVVLFLTDFDPDGEEIAQSFTRSLRDDFGISEIKPIKVALTSDQVKKFKLPPLMKAKESSSNHEKFISRHGNDSYELEALPPEKLQDLLREAIDSVIHQELFEAERNKEKEDAEYLENTRRRVLSVIGTINETL